MLTRDPSNEQMTILAPEQELFGVGIIGGGAGSRQGEIGEMTEVR